MKIRSGFVSNSSSSSFIIAFSRKMLTHEMKKNAIKEFIDIYEREVSDEMFEEALNIVSEKAIIEDEVIEDISDEELLAICITQEISNDYLIYSIDTPPDEPNRYINILSSEIKNRKKEIEDLVNENKDKLC